MGEGGVEGDEGRGNYAGVICGGGKGELGFVVGVVGVERWGGPRRRLTAEEEAGDSGAEGEEVEEEGWRRGRGLSGGGMFVVGRVVAGIIIGLVVGVVVRGWGAMARDERLLCAAHGHGIGGGWWWP